MEHGALRSGNGIWKIAVGIVVLICIVFVSIKWLSGSESVSGQSDIERDTSAVAPEDVRIKVRVLNATSVSGLARRATAELRDYGYDVVDYSTSSEKHEVTTVRVDEPNRAWAERILRVLKSGEIEVNGPQSGMVDVTVILGADWQPSAQPFRP